MGVRLSIEIISPLEESDRELLTGLAMMTLAIANHEMAKGVPQEEDDEPAPCGSMGPDPTRVCVSEVGHKGRHRFRTREMNRLAH